MNTLQKRGWQRHQRTPRICTGAASSTCAIPYYTQAPERLRYIEYPNAPHNLPEEDWEQAWNMVTAWFITHLHLD
jgi:hypothetical protein